VQQKADIPDLNFANNIAFAKRMTPAKGVVPPQDIAGVNAQGQIVLQNMYPYSPKSFQITVDNMGRNHGLLLHGLEEFFGPQSTTWFPTWAGGSQNIRFFQGIYGQGSLGAAKVRAETDTVRFHLKSEAQGYALGQHRVVRYPAFLSHALLGIPGGGSFGLISRTILEKYGRYQGPNRLAPRALIQTYDGTLNTDHPFAGIELDAGETAFMPEIGEVWMQFQDRVKLYREDHPEWDGSQPLDLETSRELLAPFVAENYEEFLP